MRICNYSSSAVSGLPLRSGGIKGGPFPDELDQIHLCRSALMACLACLLCLLIGAGSASAQTFSNEKAWDDGANFHFKASYTGSYPNVNVFIDTGSPKKGLAWYAIHADYLIENSVFSSYSGNGGNWSWTKITSANKSVPQPGAIEFTIPLSAIGSPTSAKVMLQVLTSTWAGTSDSTVVSYVKSKGATR